MAVNEEVLLDLMVKSDEAVINIGKLEQANKELKDQLDLLKKQEKEGTITTEESARARAELTAQMKENSAGIRENAKEIKVFSADVASADGSINSMRSRVADLSRAWNSLSKEARESGAGQAIQAEMADLNASINEANISVNSFKDNIGNYPQAVQAMGIENTKAGRTLQSLGITANTTAQAFAKNMVQGMQAVGKQMVQLMANPLIATLAAIAAVVITVVAAFKRSDDAMTALNVAMAPIKELIDIILEGIGALAVGIAKAFEWIATLGGTIETQGQKAVRLMDKIEDMRRANVIQESKDEEALAIAKEKATDKEAYSAEQRRKALIDVQNLEDARAKRKEEIYKAELEQFRLENAHNNKTDEFKDREAELIAQINRAETERAQNNRFILKQLNGITKEEEAQAAAAQKAQEEAAKKYQQRIENMRKLQAEALRNVDDLRIELMEKGEAQDVAREILTSKRAIEALRQRLKNENDIITKQTRKLINEQIDLQEKLLTKKLGEINEQYRSEENAAAEANLQKLIEKQDAWEEEQREKAAKAAEDKLQAQADNYANELALLDEHTQRAIDIKEAQLEMEMQAEIAAAEKIGADTLLIRKKYENEKKRIADEERNYQLSQAKVITDGLASLFGEATVAGKIAASASVAIDTYQSAFKTGAKAAEYFAAQMYPLGIMAAAQTGIVIASGAKAISDIWAVSENSTANVSGAGSGASASQASASQNVIYTNLPDMTQNYGGQSQLEAMQTIAASISAPVVSVVEITEMQNTVKVKENTKI